MNPVAGTASRLLDLYGANVWAWCWVALLPVLVPAVVAAAQRRGLRGKGSYVLPTAARILGYPAMFALLVLVPCFVFDVYFVPVLLDAHPASRTILAAPLALLDWISSNGFILSIALIALWPIWVVAAALRCARRLRRALPSN